MVAVYPGSFDPITCGHLDIIERASRIFDEVVILCAVNPSKTSMFSLEEKQRLITEAAGHLPNVRVDHFTGLLVDYMHANGFRVAIKGLRVISDFEYELQMALMNKRLAEDIETFFMMSGSEHLFLSSSLVKELAGFDTPLDALVPPCVVGPLLEKINSKR